MDSNSALAFGFSALANAHSEQHERAVEHALKALRLSPFDPLNYHPYCALAIAYLFTDRFAEAAAYSTLAIQANPHFSVSHAYLVISHVNLGNFAAARAAAQRLLEIAPGFTVSGFERGASVVDESARRSVAKERSARMSRCIVVWRGPGPTVFSS